VLPAFWLKPSLLFNLFHDLKVVAIRLLCFCTSCVLAKAKFVI